MVNRILLTTCTLALLSACDSGGGKSKPSSPDTNTGRFIDSPVSGLHYKTETQSGLTNENGEFDYIDGEMIEFSIGGIYLGTSNAQDEITPFSLLGTSPLVSESVITSTLKSESITSFDRVINIATLLQALDSDGDPENGIDLGDAHSALEASTINFYVKASEFEQRSDFLAILSELDVDSHNTFTQAAQHLYESLGVDIESDLVASMQSSENNVDKAFVSYTYNQDELLTGQETDIDNNGTIDKVISYSYDSNNRLVQTIDSSSNTIETVSYDSLNNITSKEIDSPSDTQDILQTYTYQEALLSTLETDLGADGSIDITTNYQYDESGNLLSYTVARSGENETSSSVSYTYAENKVKTLSEDSDGNGEADSATSYNYDANGNILNKSTTRFYNDSDQTSINSFVYDSNNQLSRYERDDDQDGVPEYIESYQHNDLNKRTEYKKDHDANGEWDFVAQYEYNNNGNRTRMIEDSNGDGIVDKIWQAEYQAALLDDPWKVIQDQL